MSKTPSRKNMIIISDDKSIHMANRGHSSCNKKPNTNSPIQVLMEQPVIDMKQYDSLSSNSPPQKKKFLDKTLLSLSNPSRSQLFQYHYLYQHLVNMLVLLWLQYDPIFIPFRDLMV
jgi:hypothetical protein